MANGEPGLRRSSARRRAEGATLGIFVIATLPDRAEVVDNAWEKIEKSSYAMFIPVHNMGSGVHGAPGVIVQNRADDLTGLEAVNVCATIHLQLMVVETAGDLALREKRVPKQNAQVFSKHFTFS